MSLPYTLQNRPTGSTDPKYKADAAEVMANLEYILSSVAFQKLEVDVSITSEELNCDTQNSEYGASTTGQCNLTHILGESYGGMFLGKLTGGVAAGDKVGVMDSAGRCWIATLASDNVISFGEGSGGTAGKCTWERIDGGSAYASYNDTTWMNGLTIWHLTRNTPLSNIFFKILKSEILFSSSLANGVDAADIPLIDTGVYFGTKNVEFALAEFGTHKGVSTNPHGSTLTQTNLTVTGTTSLVTLNLSGNLAIGTTKFVVAVATGNTTIAGTLTVDGNVYFGASLYIASLSVTGGGAFGGDLSTTTMIGTPLIHRDGDLTLEAHSASAQTHIRLNNPDSTYNAIVHVDKYLQFDRIGDWFTSIQFYPYLNYFRLDLNSTASDVFLFVMNSNADHPAAILSEKGYAWWGSGVFTFYRELETSLALDLYHPTEDPTWYIRNSAAGRQVNVDMDGNLTVHGAITGNFQAIVNYDNCVIVAKSGGQYQTIQSAIDSITDASITNQYGVLIYPGIYTESLVLKDYVHLVGIQKELCQITYSGENTLEVQAITAIVSNLTIGNTAATPRWLYTVSASNITFENCEFEGNTYIYNTGANVYFKNCQPRAGKTAGLSVNNGKVYTYYSTFSFAEAISTNAQIQGFGCRILDYVATGGLAVLEIGNSSLVSIFKFCLIETTQTNTHGVSVASSGHKFIDCIIKANGSGNSFYSAAAQTVIASGCVVNLDKHANVTITPGTVLWTTNVLNASI